MVCSDFEVNKWNTTDLVLSVMERCADYCQMNIHNDNVANELYWICCDLETWDEDQGFGSSDMYVYRQYAKATFQMKVV